MSTKVATKVGEHEIAKSRGWVMGEDYPRWGNNTLYLNTIAKTYLDIGETPRAAYQRLATTAAQKLKKTLKISDTEQTEFETRFFEILWNGWLVPATPVMVNFGTDKGLPISCYSGRIPDTIHGIFRKNTEMAVQSKLGGGNAYDFSQVRPMGSKIKNGRIGVSDGIVPFMKVFDSSIRVAKQGQTRPGVVALYLDARHKEFPEFLQIREPKGDVERQCHFIHQGAVIDDAFMNEVINTDGPERKLWLEILMKRVKTGEPYMFFIDNANRHLNTGFAENNLKVYHSNLCTEIMLPTDDEHTLVCCLSSLNAFLYDDWKDTDAPFLATLFLDAVMEEFIEKAADVPGIEDAVRFAVKSRALGLGLLGWHSYLQSKMIPFVGLQANSLTRVIFKNIKDQATKATQWMASLAGEVEWTKSTGRRNLTLMAVAPNLSSSKLAGGISQGIEAVAANIYVDDDSKGVYIRKNPILKALLKSKGYNGEVWDKITEAKGSVQGLLTELTDEEREVFKTAREINQLEVVRQAGIRQEYIDQGQSVNLFFAQDAPAKFINQVHIEAWKLKLKSLYYFRTESILRADSADKGLYTDECVACEG